ncbi:MAG: hypothetical protein R3C28_03015 [Pirellulaceae bacterium]
MLAQLISSLKQERDEIALKIHLGKEDLKDEWEKLEARWNQLNDDYEPAKKAAAETADDVWQAAELVGDELKSGFQKIRKSL